MRLRLMRMMMVVIVVCHDVLAGIDVVAVAAVNYRDEKHHEGDRRMQWWCGLAGGGREKRSFW